MDATLQVLDKLILESRLQDVSLIARMSAEERQARIGNSLRKLPPGRYLFGCGPYNVGLIRIGEHEIRLGRHSSPIEDNSEFAIDYDVNDAIHLSPREVSRSHATISVDSSGVVRVVDEDSTTGTWVDGVRLDSGEPGFEVSHGSIIQLGVSGINAYMLVVISG